MTLLKTILILLAVQLVVIFEVAHLALELLRYGGFLGLTCIYAICGYRIIRIAFLLLDLLYRSIAIVDILSLSFAYSNGDRSFF